MTTAARCNTINVRVAPACGATNARRQDRSNDLEEGTMPLTSHPDDSTAALDVAPQRRFTPTLAIGTTEPQVKAVV